MSSGRRLALVAVVLLALAAGLALPGAPASDGGPISRRGTYEGGRYTIEVPAGWNGGLVLYAPGDVDGVRSHIHTFPPDTAATRDPRRDLMLDCETGPHGP